MKWSWWPSRGALALDGYFTVLGPALAFPDTGDIVVDLTDQLTAFHRLLLPDQPLTEDFARTLIDNLIRGLR
ncbi:hypothetical protein GCM10023176_22630 [Micromonospora coerulea]|uniref:Uncharacterized protein n=1 Tax=Micromonospora coerulea TaxID=47856 RepID=A0ABP8SFQ6_9ACTN